MLNSFYRDFILLDLGESRFSMDHQVFVSLGSREETYDDNVSGRQSQKRVPKC